MMIQELIDKQKNIQKIAHGQKSVDYNKTNVGFLHSNQISMKDALDINTQMKIAEKKQEQTKLHND